LWLVPLVNPDGAMLSCEGLASVKNATVAKRLTAQNGDTDFSLWKANARGVDLNVNFPALWGTGVKNVSKAGAENYVGKKPLSEKESRALARFTEKIRPDCTVSYHTKGEEIYWYFNQPFSAVARDKSLAQRLARTTGYTLAYARGSAGGYKDWCIQKLGIPAFTIEAGEDRLSHPIGEEGVADIIRKNEYALYELSRYIR
jgi:g-D-glutamyl-meso-diaminopimelate peptidase